MGMSTAEATLQLQLVPRPLALQLIARRDAVAPLAAALQAAFNIALPMSPMMIVGSALRLTWGGFQTWWAHPHDEATTQALTRAAAPHAACIVQHGARTTLAVSGAAARAVLGCLVPIDLHPAVFARHATALTLLGHMNVQLTRVDADAFELSVARSMAVSAWHELAHHGEQFGLIAAPFAHPGNE